MDAERSRIAELEAAVTELREQLATMQVVGDRTDDPERELSRRGWLRAAAGAAAGGAVALAASRPAAADDPDDLTLGATKSTPGLTQGNYTGASGGVAFLFQSGDVLSGSFGDWPCALAGWTTRSNQSTGVFGFSGVPDPDGHGVVGVKDDAEGYGVLARNTEGSALRAEAGDGSGVGVMATGGTAVSADGARYGITSSGERAALHLAALAGSQAPPSRTDSHEAGELDTHETGDTTGQTDLWTCVEDGAPGVWRKLAGPATAGSLHPIEPTRVYDSRQSLPAPGRLAAGQDRTVSVADGRNVVGGAVTVSDLVPAGATAITYNLTIAKTSGIGFLAVAPGDATEAKASTINWSSEGFVIANAGLVKLDDDRRIKVFCGGAGTTDFIIDITGYYR